jgi:molybdate transport system substrate-binding protein
MTAAKLLAVALIAMVASTSLAADKLTIAAASDLKYSLDEIIADFRKAHAGADIDVIYGSSGNFKTQIEQGAPFDLYFSADIEFPRELVKAGLASSAVEPYALGRIVLWSSTLDAGNLHLADLTRSDIDKIAIANPQHAPYGKRAEEALRAAGVWESIEPKLVLGENIAQTAQFVQSGNAQVGIIALSLVLSPGMAGKGTYSLIPDNLHKPLEQGFIITRRAAGNALARIFADHMRLPATRERMAHYGFALPSAATGSGH